jgi:undecaprenyl phosphate-alpha-L-ara4N flippase subunit ArnE
VSAITVALCIACQVFLVAGQLFFKHAMSPRTPQPRSAMVRNLALGIVLQAFWFFLWLGLLQHNELSKIFPFEAFNPALLVLCAALVLKERIPAGAWVGIGVLCVGLLIVGGS